MTAHGTYTSRQRVYAAIRGEPVDRLPVGPLAVHYCADLIGASWADYSLSAETLSAAVTRYAELFEPDAVWLSADTWVTAEAMGAGVAVVGDNQPIAGDGRPLIKDLADVTAICPPNASKHGRYPLMQEATRRVREAVGEERFVVACFDQFPFSAACALMGMERAMLAPLEEPKLLEATMRKAADYAVAYGKALARAGADMLSGGDSPAGLLGPRLYEDVAAEMEREVISRLKEETGLPVSLHICGDATPILPTMTQSGADVLELDHRVNMKQATALCGPDIAIWGNLDPVGLLLAATPEKVIAETSQLLADVRQSGHSRFVVSSGCTLAQGTPSANIRAVIAAVHAATRGE